MSPEDKDIGQVWDMHDAACQIREFIREKNFSDYQGNRMLRMAVERALEIVGQAAVKVSN